MAEPSELLQVPISALQHYVYCPRQCALIHVEQTFDDSVFTQRGQQLHERAHEASSETVDGVRVERAVPLWSERLGLVGVADVVEFDGPVVRPVEYKAGRRKPGRHDDVQVCAQALCLEEMLGITHAAAVYFGVFGAMLRGDPGLTFEKRTRRPPRDPLNALLSFLYTLLTADCRAALEAVGLDSQVGFLHALRPGRPALALDLVEELRPLLADRLALTLVNRRQLQFDDFEVRPGGAVTLADAARRTVLVAYQERKREEVLHPLLDRRVPWGLVAHVQARLLARAVRGDVAAYEPYRYR